MRFLKRGKDNNNERLKDTSDKLIETVENELLDAERRINISKAKYKALILREQVK